MHHIIFKTEVTFKKSAFWAVVGKTSCLWFRLMIFVDILHQDLDCMAILSWIMIYPIILICIAVTFESLSYVLSLSSLGRCRWNKKNVSFLPSLLLLAGYCRKKGTKKEIINGKIMRKLQIICWRNSYSASFIFSFCSNFISQKIGQGAGKLK